MESQFQCDQIRDQMRCSWILQKTSGCAGVACFSVLLQRLEKMRNVIRTSEVWPLIVRAYIGNGALWKFFRLSTADLSLLGYQLSLITSEFSHFKWGNKSAFVNDFSENVWTKAWEKVWWFGEIHCLVWWFGEIHRLVWWFGEIHRLTAKEKIMISLICGQNHKLYEAEFGTSVLRLSKSIGLFVHVCNNIKKFVRIVDKNRHNTPFP
jgi:hypothetical protein